MSKRVGDSPIGNRKNKTNIAGSISENIGR